MESSKHNRQKLGEVLEAEALARYLERQHGRGMLHAHCDRITVQNVFGEERFDFVWIAQGVRWQRTG